MIVVTGAAGFIGSCMVNKLNQNGFQNLVLVDKFTNQQKNKNLEGKSWDQQIDRDVFIDWLDKNAEKITYVFHIGARTDTTEFDSKVFDALNLNYSKDIWRICTRKGIPFLYASSAATYGMGEYGYIDEHSIIEKLKPLNPYGESKNDFDKWVLQQNNTPPFWCGFKFFNVYGPNEYHKSRMASVVYHAYNQIKEKGSMKLFRSHNPGFKDGEQKRDFIYVKDLIDVLLFFMEHQQHPGIYNLGTGTARTFLNLAKATFHAMNITEDISFIDTPEDIRDKYQYFTEARMTKLQAAGYTKAFTSLEQGIGDYVKNYLQQDKYL
ncbi:MAG: ADP-glyceromanno-heptose 6-epimerase [Bacteroidota bacterium]|nr:MAG: ADP-glyceromanno-heptose 6-epimerase [Bacteroidota bacterium]